MQTPDVYERARELLRRLDFPTASDFSQLILNEVVDRLDLYPCHPLLDHLLVFSEFAYQLDGFAGLPEPPESSDGTDGAIYRGQLIKIINRITNPSAIAVAKATLIESFCNFRNTLPNVALQQWEDILAIAREERTIAADVELIEVLPDVAKAIEQLSEPFFSKRARSSSIFEEIREQLDFNRHKASGLMLVPGYVTTSQKLTMPSEYCGGLEEMVLAYLRQTNLEQLFFIKVPAR